MELNLITIEALMCLMKEHRVDELHIADLHLVKKRHEAKKEESSVFGSDAKRKS